MKTFAMIAIVGFVLWAAATGRLTTWYNLAAAKMNGATAG